MDGRPPSWSFLRVALLAAAILAITMGMRASMGLFLSPLDASTGLGVATISLAMAVGQLVWGVVQPVAGAVADRHGHMRVVMIGVLLAALGNALTPFVTSAWGLIGSIGILAAAGAGAASLSVLIGVTAQRVPPERRGMSSGIINAGASFGQFVFAPVTQALISALGWKAAMWTLADISLLALPVASLLHRRAPTAAVAPASSPSRSPLAPEGLRDALRRAFRDPSYGLLHAGFFTCGFHVAFLMTHLPGEVQLYGLSAQVASWALGVIGLTNIAGSLLAGWSLRYCRGKSVLFWMYGSRSLLIVLYLLAPRTALTFYLFAVGLGLTWLATVPPTAGVVGKLFGTRYLATLFGLTLLSHQVGAFFGAWLGGVTVTALGSYAWMWYADAALAALAAVLNLPIREARVVRALRPA